MSDEFLNDLLAEIAVREGRMVIALIELLDYHCSSVMPTDTFVEHKHSDLAEEIIQEMKEIGKT